jgi:hypothetical protein
MHKETIREQLDVNNTLEDTKKYRRQQRVHVKKTEDKGTIQ